VKSDITRHLEIIKENAVDIIAEDGLKKKLENSFKQNKPLKLKIGFDPTSKDIHLGHTVLLRKLRKLQDLGHRVYFIIGDFTAKIGDPSGRTSSRPVLSDKEIKANASTYTQQAFKILDCKKTEVIYNSVWYKKMDLPEFLSLLSFYTVARILERDDFSQRLKENRPLTILEIVYPLIQGYDSYKMEADIEFGGTDQKFNLIVGRHLQEVFGQEPQTIVTMPILVGLDGKNKMSKSLGNYIGITENPQDMFGKLMSISDDLMWEYFRLLTDIDSKQLKALHPKEAKVKLAKEVVSYYYSAKIAEETGVEFERVFSQKAIPQEMPLYRIKGSSLDLVECLYEAKITGSKNEARRLLSQGAISSIEPDDPQKSEVIKAQKIDVPQRGLILKVGKKSFLKVVSE
jgi:tyrosyl-tRNA synthetase